MDKGGWPMTILKLDRRGAGSQWRDEFGRWAKPPEGIPSRPPVEFQGERIEEGRLTTELPEETWEVVLYTSYKEKKRGRHDRYEVRTVVKARTPGDAIERAMGKFGSTIPDEHLSYLDGLGLFAVDSNEAATRIEPSQAYSGTKYYRHSAGSPRPTESTYHWGR